MMKSWLALLSSFFLLSASLSLGSGNGSSGVGSAKTPLGSGVALVMPADSVVFKGGMLTDAKTGERLIRVEQAGMGPFRNPPGGEWVSAKFGALPGYEFMPSISGVAPAANLWIACSTSARRGCLKLTPLSAKNPKVSHILGALSNAD